MGARLPLDSSEEDSSDLAPLAEINVTPFVDVMLVLLIIFMVTAPLMLAGVKVDMPQTRAARQNPPQKPLVVTVSADGALYVRDDRVARDRLASAMASLFERDGESVVYIKADKAISYGFVMDILGDISESGFSKISLLSERRHDN
ncbi:MAG: protein TolR [Rhodomicrobium sp.]|nr:protein TolR [Rhodomicrobium sp.]